MYASMEKTDRETHDFMNVESFSQLPFIRSAPPSAKERTAGGSGGGGGAIRLFGKEFINSSNDDNYNSNEDDCSTYNNGNKEISNRDNNNNNNNNSATTEISSSSSSRKFECHYCCRNFPTSQALGGHQNAHKRERQQAKRAHLQSAMAHGAAAGLADAAHVYGLMSYGPRLGSVPAPMAYHSRLYGSSYHQPQAINGSPLALWRIPAAGGPAQYGSARLGSMHRQMELKPPPLTSISGGNSASQIIRFGYEAKNEMHDHVSLDLRL